MGSQKTFLTQISMALQESPKERRIDPGGKMDSASQAGRALGRKNEDGIGEFEALAPEARRAAIVEANATNKFREKNMGERITRILDRIEGVRTPEQQQLLNRLMSQCESAASVWTEKFPLKGAPEKSKLVAAAQKWLQGLPEEVLQGFVDLCPKTAALRVVPGGVKAPQLMGLIDANKTISGQKNREIWWPEGWNKVQSEGWKFAITDGIENIKFDPSIFYVNPNAPERERQPRTNEQMVAEYERRFTEKNVGIMPQYGYVPAAAGALAEGEVLDRECYTAFKRPAGAAFLPRAYWDNFRVDLNYDAPGGSFGDLRCRPWVEGGCLAFSPYLFLPLKFTF